MFNIELFLKMNEQVGESGAHCLETEQEKACKKQGGKNAVQVDLLVRRRQVYPKKPCYNFFTPNQLEDKKKAANVQRKEKRVAFKNSLTPDQLKDKKNSATIQRKEKRVAFENSLTPDELHCNTEKKKRGKLCWGIKTCRPAKGSTPMGEKGNSTENLEV